MESGLVRGGAESRGWTSRGPGALLFACTLFSLGITACGGVVEGDPASGESEPQQAGRETQEPPESAPKGADFELEECTGGFSSHGDTCPWIDEDEQLCFASKEAACSCLCPMNRESICRSGLYNDENGRVVVRCD